MRSRSTRPHASSLRGERHRCWWCAQVESIPPPRPAAASSGRVGPGVSQAHRVGSLDLCVRDRVPARASFVSSGALGKGRTPRGTSSPWSVRAGPAWPEPTNVRYDPKIGVMRWAMSCLLGTTERTTSLGPGCEHVAWEERKCLIWFTWRSKPTVLLRKRARLDAVTRFGHVGPARHGGGTSLPAVSSSRSRAVHCGRSQSWRWRRPARWSGWPARFYFAAVSGGPIPDTLMPRVRSAPSARGTPDAQPGSPDRGGRPAGCPGPRRPLL